MKLFLPLLLALAACSDGHASGQPDQKDAQHAIIAGEAKIPLAGRVTDAANIISSSQEATLSNRLAELEQATQHQMVMVTVKSLDGQDISTFTRDLANAWGIGRKNYDDGVVVLVAPTERKVRIEVGRGLERTLPNLLCQKILDEKMLPRFRKGELEGGIVDGVDALISALKPARR